MSAWHLRMLSPTSSAFYNQFQQSLEEGCQMERLGVCSSSSVTVLAHSSRCLSWAPNLELRKCFNCWLPNKNTREHVSISLSFHVSTQGVDEHVIDVQYYYYYYYYFLKIVLKGFGFLLSERWSILVQFMLFDFSFSFIGSVPSFCAYSWCHWWQWCLSGKFILILTKFNLMW